MKILHIQKVAGIAGSENHLLSLLPALKQNGLETTMLVLAGPGDQPAPFVTSMRANGIDCEVISMRGDLDPLLLVQLIKFVRGHAGQLVHTHLIHADLYGTLAARLAGIPFVVSTKHGYNPWRTKWQYAFLDRLASLLQNRIITISDALGSWLVEIEGLPPKKLSTVHYALDVNRFRSSTAGELSFEASKPVIGTVSRLIHQKGIHVLLQAFAACARQHPTISLVVVGDGPERSALENSAKELLPHRAAAAGFSTASSSSSRTRMFPTPMSWRRARAMAKGISRCSWYLAELTA